MAHPETTSFGYRDVPAADKATLVRGVFDRVSARYDLMNDVMSLGLHRLWKNEMVATVARAVPRGKPLQLLDVAGGTGDIAFRLRERLPNADVTLCDINQSMLTEGRARALDRNAWQGIRFVCGNAETLPIPDGIYDAYTIAFGIRNVTHIEQALREAHRALKPGGFFACLEFTPAVTPLLSRLYDFYSFAIIPPAGKLLAGDGEPYRYLAESIRRFPLPERFLGMMKTAGFARGAHRHFSGGVATLFTGWKL